ncbi:MAG: PIN domain-containing protein [Candidatus Electrothrix sp. AS4_5]|nr:PIN domain-containing protein [Candidatus Electrothrix sp. AX1]MCI5182342.1 PIN domain-containing protein [Candidatus Electrothrix gigas]MCI5190235.1 PIN domain-containing protein [Candidatus Electrothrix gigas]
MMTGIDTNVLVRYIAQDDEVQAQAATAFIEKHCASGEKIFINHTVLCELIWVLKKCYKLSKPKTVAVLERTVNTSQFTFENPQILRQALNDYKDGSADFSDYVIGRTNQHYGCVKTVTFDRAASKAEGFKLLATKR